MPLVLWGPASACSCTYIRTVLSSSVRSPSGIDLSFADQVSELFDVPAADVAKDSLTFLARLARSLSVFMGVVVVARCSMSEPWEACQPLALGQHVASHACLSGGERIRQQIALEFRHSWPVFHIEVFAPEE